MPFAIQGLIGTLAGPEDPGTAFVGFYHDLGEAAGRARRVGLRPRGDGRGHARAARRGGGGGRAGAARARRWSGCWWRTDARRRGRSRAARRCARAPCSRTPTRVRTAAPGRRARPATAGARPGPVVKVDAAARRAARLPVVARARSRGGARSTSASRSHDLTRGGRRRARRAARRRAVDRGRVPDGHRRLAGAPGQPRALALLPVLPAGRRRRRGGRRRRSRASPRSALGCPTGSSIAWR